MSDDNDTCCMDRGLSIGVLVDKICDEFETACQRGRQPSVEQFLDRAGSNNRDTLLFELLLLEVVYRRKDSQNPSPVEWAWC